jgi:hypothetical protein
MHASAGVSSFALGAGQMAAFLPYKLEAGSVTMIGKAQPAYVEVQEQSGMGNGARERWVPGSHPIGRAIRP